MQNQKHEDKFMQIYVKSSFFLGQNSQKNVTDIKKRKKFSMQRKRDVYIKPQQIGSEELPNCALVTTHFEQKFRLIYNIYTSLA